MTRAEQLNIAQANKRDEFYTQLCDIEAELVHYKHHFAGKTVYCNCDDPSKSNFTRFFIQNFHNLKLRKLTCSCYKPCPTGLFAEKHDEHASYLEYDGTEKSNAPKMLKGNGDFRSKECLKLLESADIVVTNPPFSLFRDFLKTLVSYDKKFIIIGNVNAISYKECFSLIQKGKMWLGRSIHSGDREFRVPDDYPLDAAKVRIDEKGNRYVNVKGVRWFTNLKYTGMNNGLDLKKRYNPEEYPKFDNVDAINVSKTKDIPYDYNGLMGVPITFIDKFDPRQFIIIGNEYMLNIPGGRCYLNGQRMYSRIFIKRITNEKSQHLDKQSVLTNNISI